MKKVSSLQKIIIAIETYCNENNIEHRFVGGVSFGGLLNEKTTWNINLLKKTVHLTGNNPLELFRNDHSIRDIDLIILGNDRTKLHDLKSFLQTLCRTIQPFPSVSIEAIVHRNTEGKSLIPQFVSALTINEKSDVLFSFENIAQKISWRSLEAWTVILDDKTSYTVRNPIADYFGYHLRLPSGPKPKDKEKLTLLKKLADDVIQEGKKEKINYLSDQLYGSWETYIEKLRMATTPSIAIKKRLLKLYWTTVGTSLAHEKGFFGKLFSPLSNQFTGSKQ